MRLPMTVLFLAASATAQQVTLEVVSGSFRAIAAGRQSQYATWSEGGRASASDSVGACVGSAVAAGDVQGLTASVSTTADVFGLWPPCPISADAQARLTVRLRASSPVAGVLNLSGLGSSGAADVGRDGTSEWRNGAAVSVPVIVTSAGLEIEMSCRSSALVMNSHDNAYVRVMFTAGDNGLVPQLAPCGSELGGYRAVEPGGGLRLRFDASRAPITPFGFFVLGLTQQNIVVPPVGCVLGTDVLIAVPVAVSPFGTATLTGTLAAPVPPGIFYVQYLTAVVGSSGTLWSMGNRVQVTTP